MAIAVKSYKRRTPSGKMVVVKQYNKKGDKKPLVGGKNPRAIRSGSSDQTEMDVKMLAKNDPESLLAYMIHYSESGDMPGLDSKTGKFSLSAAAKEFGNALRSSGEKRRISSVVKDYKNPKNPARGYLGVAKNLLKKHGSLEKAAKAHMEE